MKSNTIGLLLAFVLMLCAGAAEAHHVMDGEMPATWWQGLLSGLGHPIIGVDHLAAIFGVGALAAAQGASARVMIAFVVAMLAGAAIHAGKADIPAGEILVGVSLLAFAALLFARPRLAFGMDRSAFRRHRIDSWIRDGRVHRRRRAGSARGLFHRPRCRPIRCRDPVVPGHETASDAGISAWRGKDGGLYHRPCWDFRAGEPGNLTRSGVSCAAHFAARQPVEDRRRARRRD